jgi:hypothetical protein
MNFGPFEMRFPSCDLLKIKEDAQIAHLDFQISDTQPAFFHHPSLGLLQEVDLHAAPHVLFAVWKFLNNVFPKQWIGQSGPVA